MTTVQEITRAFYEGRDGGDELITPATVSLHVIDTSKPYHFPAVITADRDDRSIVIRDITKQRLKLAGFSLDAPYADAILANYAPAHPAQPDDAAPTSTTSPGAAPRQMAKVQP